jgi:hypothetical protein
MSKRRIRTVSGLPGRRPLPDALPPRQFRAMQPQPIIAWTPARLLRAVLEWLWEEEQLGQLTRSAAGHTAQHLPHLLRRPHGLRQGGKAESPQTDVARADAEGI